MAELTALQRVTVFKRICDIHFEINQNLQEIKNLRHPNEQLAEYFIHHKPPQPKVDTAKVAQLEVLNSSLNKEKSDLLRFLAGGSEVISDDLIVECVPQLGVAASLKASEIWAGNRIVCPSYLSDPSMRRVQRAAPNRQGGSVFEFNPEPIVCASPGNLQHIVSSLATRGKGIFCAAESTANKTKRLAGKLLRELLVNPQDVSPYLSGIVIYEQTIGVKREEDQKPFVQCMDEVGILCGLLLQATEDSLHQFQGSASKFSGDGIKFIEVEGAIGVGNNHQQTIEIMVQMAALCQTMGLVPILCPSITAADGTHIKTVAAFTCAVLNSIFQLLESNHLLVPNILLKLSFVTAGSTDLQEMAHETLTVLQKCVPSEQKLLKDTDGVQPSPFDEFKSLAKANSKASLGIYEEE